MKKEGYSRPGLFGTMNHYDANGNKIGESTPGFFGGMNNYDARNGITTGQNELFIRYWYEVPLNFDKWYKCNKGGAFRRWYGNQEYVIDWENDGWNLKNFRDEKGKQRSTLRSIEYNFQKAVTMSRIGSGISSFRWLPQGFITEGASNNIYFGDEDKDVYNLLAF